MPSHRISDYVEFSHQIHGDDNWMVAKFFAGAGEIPGAEMLDVRPLTNLSFLGL